MKNSAPLLIRLDKAYYYQYDLSGHSESVKAASSILNKYTGPQTEYYHFNRSMKNYNQIVNCIRLCIRNVIN